MQFLNTFGVDKNIHVPEGVCAKSISFDIEEGKLRNLHFTGGCQGNLRAISVLLEGMPVEEVISKVKGITCGTKGTSCTDQLAQILEKQLSFS
nr:TIGR03905 family TSCPD domain-containing protein [uncultured Desulfobulbus sp.]